MKSFLLIVIPMTLLVLITEVRAQDLEPRAFSPAPVGMNFGLLGYGYGEGNVLFDQSLLVEDATGKLGAAVPFAWGDYEGLWLGQPAKASRRGFADPIVSFAVNFVGAPARTIRELATYRERTVVSASVLVNVPPGQYDPSKLINLGSNRWGFRARLGASQ